MKLLFHKNLYPTFKQPNKDTLLPSPSFTISPYRKTSTPYSPIKQTNSESEQEEQIEHSEQNFNRCDLLLKLHDKADIINEINS